MKIKTCFLLEDLRAISSPTSFPGVLAARVQIGSNMAQLHDLGSDCCENSCATRKPSGTPHLGPPPLTRAAFQLRPLRFVLARTVMQTCQCPASCLTSSPGSQDFPTLSQTGPMATDQSVWIWWVLGS